MLSFPHPLHGAHRTRRYHAIALTLLLGLTACTSQVAPLPAVSATPPPTATPQIRDLASPQTPELDPRASELMIPVLSAAGQVIQSIQYEPLLINSPQCSTPMSLMLHSAFGVERMEALAQEILAQNLKTSTYEMVLQDLRRGKCPDPDTIIVSVDDLGTNWLRPVFMDMIAVFTEKDLVLVVGLVVKGPQDEAIWEYVRTLPGHGIEVASHSMYHSDLTLLDDEALKLELEGSYDVICENLGKCPITLLIPFGKLDEEGRVLALASDYTFLIGIQGGLTFQGPPPFFLGRIHPDNDNQTRTINLLKGTFLPKH